MNCRAQSFLETAKFNTLVYYSLSLITIPVNVYGIYLILCKSGKTLRNAKWVMLNSQIWSSFSNFLLTTMIVPLLMFPVAGGYPNGLFTLLGIGPLWQMAIGVGAIAQIGSSMVIIFENQQYHLVTNGIKLKSKNLRRLFVVCNIALGFTFFIPTMFRVPDQEAIKQQIIQWFTCPPPEFFAPNTFILADDPVLISFLLFTTLSVYALEALFFISHCSINLFYNSRKLSNRTKTLQRKFFVSVCVQIFLPFSIVGGPVTYAVFSISTKYYNQLLNNLCIILISLHGFFSTISTVLIHANMRKEAFSCCGKPTRIMSSYQST